MPLSPDHPTPVSTVDVTPNGLGTGDSVRYEVDNSGTLVQIRQSSTGQGTHMRFIYDVPGLATAAQHRFTNLTPNGATQNAGTGAVGIAVNANGIQAVDMHVDGAQARAPRSRTAASMEYREDTSYGMITPTNASPVHSRPGSPMCESPVRPTTSNFNRPPVSTFGSMSIHDARNQQSRLPRSQAQRHQPLRRQQTVIGNQMQNLQRHESQILLNIDRLQADISREHDQVRLEDSQYRVLAQRAREAREQLQAAVRNLDAVRMEQMRLEDQERRRLQGEELGQIGSDDVGDLYADDDDATAAIPVDHFPQPPFAPTRSTFQQFVTPPPSDGEINTRHAGHTPRTPYSLSPTPPAEIRQAQHVRFSDRFAQGHLVTPSSPLSVATDDNHAHLGHFEQNVTTRRPLRRQTEQLTGLEDKTDGMYSSDEEDIRYHSQRHSSEAPSNFSTATTEQIDADDQMGLLDDIPEESMQDIDRAHAMYQQRLSIQDWRIQSTLDNAPEPGRQTPTHTYPLRAGEDRNDLVDAARYNQTSGPTRSQNPSTQTGRAVFPRRDGSLRPQSRGPFGPSTKGKKDTNLAAEEQLASPFSGSRLSVLSSTGTAGSSAAVEQLIHIQPVSPPVTPARAGPGPATQAARHRVQTREAPITPPSGVVTRSQARRMNENKANNTADLPGPKKGKGKGRN